MGYVRHHAIIVVGNRDELGRARNLAVRLFDGLCDVSPCLDSRMNHYGSFLVPPDGSKEFWHDSNRGDIVRADFREQVKDLAGPCGLTVTEVCMGDEQGPDRIVGEEEGRDARIRALAELDIARTDPIDLDIALE